MFYLPLYTLNAIDPSKASPIPFLPLPHAALLPQTAPHSLHSGRLITRSERGTYCKQRNLLVCLLLLYAPSKCLYKHAAHTTTQRRANTPAIVTGSTQHHIKLLTDTTAVTINKRRQLPLSAPPGKWPQHRARPACWQEAAPPDSCYCCCYRTCSF